MFDLNSLQVFEKVASLKSFSAAARVLGMPKSNVSRAIARLEEELGTRLFQRTTRDVALTTTGLALLDRCAGIMSTLSEAVDYVGALASEPQGLLKITAGVGFGVNILGEHLPEFLKRYPKVRVVLHLDTRLVDLVSENIDVAIRLGPMPDSGLVAVKLGEMQRYLCAAPSYLSGRSVPSCIDDLKHHDVIDMVASNGRHMGWTFFQNGHLHKPDLTPRVCVDEALTIFRMVVNGAGIGVISGYLCAPEIAAGRLVRLLPDYTLPAVPVSIVFPSRRELAPSVRAFVEFMKEVSQPGQAWRYDPMVGPSDKVCGGVDMLTAQR